MRAQDISTFAKRHFIAAAQWDVCSSGEFWRLSERVPAERFLVVLRTVAAALLMSGQSVFVACVMIAFDYVTSPVSRLVAMEVVVGLIPTPRHRSSVTVMRIKPVIDMAGEVFRAVEPGASSNKHAANKPVGPVVAVRRAIVGSV